MTIRLQFNSVQFNYEELKADCPELTMMIQSSLPQRKKARKKPRKKKETVAHLIDELIDNIDGSISGKQ